MHYFKSLPFITLLNFFNVSAVSTAPKELREVDMTAKMSKSKKKKLKKRAKRNQQLMDETMQHIVEKEQEQVEGQQVGNQKTTEENVIADISSSGDQLQQCKTEFLSSDKIKDGFTKQDQNSDIKNVLKSEVCDEDKTSNKVNGTSQNGGAVHNTNNCQNNSTLDELEDIDECDALDESCKVDGN